MLKLKPGICRTHLGACIILIYVKFGISLVLNLLLVFGFLYGLCELLGLGLLVKAQGFKKSTNTLENYMLINTQVRVFLVWWLPITITTTFQQLQFYGLVDATVTTSYPRRESLGFFLFSMFSFEILNPVALPSLRDPKDRSNVHKLRSTSPLVKTKRKRAQGGHGAPKRIFQGNILYFKLFDFCNNIGLMRYAISIEARCLKLTWPLQNKLEEIIQ